MRSARVALALILPCAGVPACSAALDFDLSGGTQASDAGGRDRDAGPTPSDGSVDLPDAASDTGLLADAGSPPFGPPNCLDTGLVFCDGFERADVVGPFLARDLSPTARRLAFEPGFVAAETKTLELDAPSSIGVATVGIAAENLTFAVGGNRTVAIDVLLRLDYAAGAFAGSVQRKLVVVRPFAKIDSVGAEEAYLFVDATGLGVAAKTFSPSSEKRLSVPFPRGEFHRVSLVVRFDDPNGHIDLDIDGVNRVPSTKVTTLSTGTTPTMFSVAVEASSVSAAPALVARFDNVIVTQK